MFRSYFILQMLDTGEFVARSSQDGQLIFVKSFERAFRFESVSSAFNHAKGVDDSLFIVTVHQIWEPVYETNGLCRID